MSVPLVWTRGQENPEELESKLLEQKELFSRMNSIVQIKIDENYKQIFKSVNYNTPCWAERQADSIGYARALEEIKDLLKFTKEQNS